MQKLLELYALGVEYYESLRSYKYLYFQKRMNGLMMSPQVIQAMNNSVAPAKPPATGESSKQHQEAAVNPKTVAATEEEHHKMLLVKCRQE